MQVLNQLINQIAVMFLYMLAGFVLYKGKKITKEGSASMAACLVWLIIPVVVVKSFCVAPDKERIAGLLWSIAATVAVQALSIGLSAVIFKNRPIDNIACAFSNAGFIGIPLVSAAIGSDAVFYIAFYVATLNIMQWGYGSAVLTDSKFNLGKKTLIHPLTLGLLLGLFLFFTGLGTRMPKLLMTTMNGISGLSAPLAMLVMGVYLAQADLKTLFNDKYLYIGSAVRLLVIPGLTLVLLFGLYLLIPALNAKIVLTLLITAIAPAGANVAVYAQLLGKDYVYACKTVVLSTLLSLVTMPLIVLLAQIMIH